MPKQAQSATWQSGYKKPARILASHALGQKACQIAILDSGNIRFAVDDPVSKHQQGIKCANSQQDNPPSA